MPTARRVHAVTVASLTLAALGCALAPAAHAQQVIYSSGDPFGGPFGVTGYDVHAGQAVAVRFTPAKDCAFTGVSLWLMSHLSNGNEGSPVLHVSLQAANMAEAAAQPPCGVVMEQWVVSTAPVAFAPALHQLDSEGFPRLIAGQQYWIVAESTEPLRRNPVWAWSGQDTGYVATRGTSGVWQCGPGVAVAAEVRARVCGTSDFDGDGAYGQDTDIEAFFMCLGGQCCETCHGSDFDGDGAYGQDADIEAFFLALGGAPVC